MTNRNGRIIGSFTLRWSDDRVWGPNSGGAGYLHRLASAADVAGSGVGLTLVRFAAQAVIHGSFDLLRLDCEQHNARLRGYYEALGFDHVRDVDGIPYQTRPGTRSASLYQAHAADLV